MLDVVPQGSAISRLVDGLKYVLSESRIKLLLVYVSVISIFGFSLLTLIPAWAVSILNGDVRTNGWLLSARGLGSLLGALMVAYVGSRQVRGKIWQAGWYVLPLALLGFGLVRDVPLSLSLMVIMGWGMMTVLNISNGLIQSYVPDDLRGRVMSVYVLVFFGSATVGSFLAGSVASRLGEPVMVFISAGVLLIALTATIFFRETIRRF